MNRNYEIRSKFPLSGVVGAIFSFQLACLASTAVAQEDNQSQRSRAEAFESRLQHLWELDPELGVKWELDPSFYTDRPGGDVSDSPSNWHVFPEDVSLSLKAVRSLIRSADRLSLAERAEAQQEILRKLDAGIGNPQLELALLSALIAISDKSLAEEMWSQYGASPRMRVMVEEALIRWKSDAALETWRTRMDPGHTPLADLMLAIRGVEAVGDPSDREPLERIVSANECPDSIRVLAAQALGRIASQGLEPLANEILSSASPHCHLMAAYLLAQHRSRQAVDRLVDVLHSEHEPAQRLALKALAKAAPEQLEANFEFLSQHPDPEIRILAVEASGETTDNEQLWRVAGLMGDPHLQVRSTAREWLSHAFTGVASKPDIAEIIRTRLASDSTLAVEQAIFLSVHLEQSQFCHRFIDLQMHPEPRVFVTAAWALQQLVEDPEEIELVRQRAIALSESHFQGAKLTVDQGTQLAFLLEVLGKQGVDSAKPLLKRFIPKYCAPDVTRASAIWALGKLWENSENGGLASQLAQRMHDDNENYPEHDLVKFSCALALGRIQYPESQFELEKHEERPPYPIGLARQWALSRF
ncbi:MAG: HEAT repeat domain-containing protein [bacterium]|nr:HEAT repeat domain-containing protein [bacterium]